MNYLELGIRFSYEVGRMNPWNPIYEVVEIGDEIKIKRLETGEIETLDVNDEIIIDSYPSISESCKNYKLKQSIKN